jgi:two-component system sensor histidine kinase HydH
MWLKKFLSNKRIIFVSPWLIVASFGLLTLIVVILAFNNLKREMNLLNVGMYGRGQSLARFVGAGTRASMLHGMQGAVHTQSLIEQASDDPDILYIAVVDPHGKIMAHSDSSLVGTKIDRESNELSQLANHNSWHVVQDGKSKVKIFEVVNNFAPFQKHQSDLSGRVGVLKERRVIKTYRKIFPPLSPSSLEASGELTVTRKSGQDINVPYDWCSSFITDGNDIGFPGNNYKILVGLDMKDQERVSRQARLHIFSLSVLLLLVGLGGWFSLLIAQSYSATQRAFKNIKAFADLLVLKLPVGIIATEKSGRIKTFNRAVGKMLGIKAGDAVGANPSAVLPFVLSSFFDENQPDKEVFEQEIDLPKENGVNLSVHVSMVPIFDDKGFFAGRVVLVQDLTQIKKLEKEVTKHDRLVALGKMAAGVAHEVRNPLSSIKGFATLLGSNFQEGSEGQKASMLLVNEVDRLNRSITELLNYSRPLPLQKKKVSLADIIGDSLRLMSSDASELGIELEFAVEDDLPEIYADPDRISQVLLNLYLNAFQAMPDGGKLLVHVHYAPELHAIEIRVADNGCGVDTEILGRLIDPYFTTKPDGTGLGLALAHKIIDEHNGLIKFESVSGQGTTVIIELPVS